MKSSKHILFYLLYVLIGVSAYAQIPNSSNSLNTQGNRAGQWTILYDDNWKIVHNQDSASYYRIINFKDGKPEGKVIDFYLNGGKQWEGFLTSFEPDTSYGHAIYYHPNGKKRSEGDFEDSKEIGLWFYWTEKGKQITERKYDSKCEKSRQLGVERYNKGEYSNALNYLKEAIKYAENDYGVNHPEYISVLNLMGVLYRTLGDYEKSTQLHRSAIEILKKTFNNKHPYYSESLNYLGLSLIGLNEYNNAEKAFKELIKISKKKDENYLISINNIGQTYATQKKYDIAIKYFLTAKRLFNRDSSIASLDYTNILDNIGQMYSMKGDYIKAEVYWNESLSIRKKILVPNHPLLANSYRNLGMMYYYTSNFKLAQLQLENALPIFLQTYGQNNAYVIDMYNSLAYVELALNNYDKSIEYFNHNLMASGNLQGYRLYALSGLGTLFYATANLLKAKEYFELFFIEYERLKFNDPKIHLKSLLLSAAVYESLGDIEKAIEIGNQGLLKSKKQYGENHPEYAIVLQILGKFYMEKGEMSIAYNLLTKSKLIVEKSNYKNYPGVVNIYNSLALFHMEKGDIIAAIENYEKALEIDNKDPIVTFNLALLYYDYIGDKEKSYSLINRSIEYQKEINETHPTYAKFLLSSSKLDVKSGNYENALNKIDTALSIIKKSLGENCKEYLEGLSALSRVYYSKQEYVKSNELAIKILNRTKDIFSENSSEYASALDAVAYSYYNINKTQQVDYYSQALEKKKLLYQNDHRSYLNTLSGLSYAYYNLDEFQKSEAYFSEYIKAENISSMKNITFLSKEERDIYWDNIYIPKYYYNFLVMLPNSEVISKAFNNTMFLKGGLINAEENYARNIRNSNDSIMVYLNDSLNNLKKNLANLYPLSIDSDSNYTNMNSLSSQISELEKFISRRFSDQGNMSNYLFNWNDVKSNLGTDEALVELINFNLNYKQKIFTNIGLGFGANIDTVTRYPYILNFYENSPMPKTGLKIGDELIEINGTSAFNRTFEFLKSVLACGDKIELKIRRNEKLLDSLFSISCDSIFDVSYYQNYYAALIVTSETKEHPKLVLLKNGNDLEGIHLAKYQQYLTNPKLREDTDWESYQYFWAAIDSAIRDKKVVYVSPDGVYNKINLETLITPDGKYLSDAKDIRVIGSSRELLDVKHPIQKVITNAVLVGNPDFKTNSWTGDTTLIAYTETVNDEGKFTTRSFENTNISQLPAAEEEVKTITALLNNNNFQTTTLTGTNAREELIKSVISPSVLHIATHGYFEKDLKKDLSNEHLDMGFNKIKENPMLRSGLLLAGAENTIKGNYNALEGRENGILTAYEVQQMNLDSTELVVLSACETGLGEIKNGEGVYGLQRAFKIAGAKSIIMSLWKVEDNATQLLMTSFYENWLSGKTKRDALKLAKESLKNNPRYNHPFYWGAFVLIGE